MINENFDQDHRFESCDLCKGASAHRLDHYAIGRLRIQIGEELGLPHESIRQSDLNWLLEQRRKKLGLTA